MSQILLDTDDVGTAETVLSATFARIRLAVCDDATLRFRVRQSRLGSLAVHDLHYDNDFRYVMEPVESLIICLTESGEVNQSVSGREPASAGPGAVMAIGALEGEPVSGVVRRGRFTQLVIPRRSLSEIASGPVHLTGVHPVTAEANDHLARLIAYVREIADSATAAESPILAGEIRRHVAATVLATFPNSAWPDDHRGDERDGTPDVMRRAIAYMEQNAARHLSVVDIAAAVYVTPRALQYGFRKHRDCTPLEFLRRIRLHHAHLDLAAADPAITTVADVARRWGFGHAGRFAAFHRDRYGESPQQTLRGANIR